MADEVSEQPEVSPEGPVDTPVEEEAPVEEQEASVEEATPVPEPETQPVKEPAPESIETPAKKSEKEPDPPELEELDVIAKKLKSLAKACENLLNTTTDLQEQEAVQDAADKYSHALARLPEALQLLNDYRRHGKMLLTTGTSLEKQLIKLRGGDKDALTSEESRILLATITAKDTTLSIISALEHVLAHVRHNTQPLLALISYDRPGFREFATNVMRAIRADHVSKIIHDQNSRVLALREDLSLMHDLKDHADSLDHEASSAE